MKLWQILHVEHVSLDKHQHCGLIFHSTNIDYLYVDVISPILWVVWTMFCQFACGCHWVQTPYFWVTNWVVWIASMLVMVPNAFPVNVKKIDYHNAQLAWLLDSRSWDQAWLIKGPSCLHRVQTEISSWM